MQYVLSHYFLFKFTRAIGDKSSPPTIPLLEIESSEMIAEEEEEQKEEEGETPESSLSLDPSLQMDIEHLTLEEDISHTVMDEKEELNQSDAAEKTEENEPNISQEMEDNRSPQGIITVEICTEIDLLDAEMIR